ncbi:MAG: OadG family protein [Dehalococcoidales bacterium]|nr:OadG family protein [Dehalococcoidales bacterium]
MDVAFGVTMMVMGMGVTLITLYLLSLVIGLLVKLFPYKAEEEKQE